MRKRGLILFCLAIATATADVVDDLGVTEHQFAEGFRFPAFGDFGMRYQTLVGLPLSEEHAAAVEAELVKQRSGFVLANFHEGCGNFNKALETDQLDPLSRVRLFYRSGRLDEARVAMGGEEFRKLAESWNPGYLLLPACRPFEDAQAWDDLRGFLRLLSERMTSPLWRGALWAEELDIAWNLDRVQALLDEAANDPLKLAVFQQRLGNLAERDRLAVGLVENASPARSAELLGHLSNCAEVRKAAVRHWNRADLSADERAELLSQFILLQREEEFDEVLRVWLVNGGDAMPLADVIWRRWSMVPAEQSTQRAAVQLALFQRHPDEPRFQALLARQLIRTDPPRAAELFEKVAGLPLLRATEGNPMGWLRESLAYMTEEIRGDLPFFAIRGLGMLDRQDRVRAVLDRQAGWSELPSVDQVRYLAAGGMDFAMVEAATGADFTKPENDALAGWLKADLEIRMKIRVLPQEAVRQIAARFDVLVAGSETKKMNQLINNDAVGLLETLGDEEIAVDVWKESVGRLMTIVAQRDSKQVENLENSLRAVAARHPQLKGLFADGGKPQPPGRRSEDIAKGTNAIRWLTLFSPPKILRIRATDDVARFGPRGGFGGGFGGPNRGIPLELLSRWSGMLDGGGMEIPRLGVPLGKEDLAVFQSLMRRFGAGNPRRLFAEILIAKGMLDCGDEALKAEAQASVAAMMAGEKEAMGTEAFRFATLAANRAEEGEMKAVLEQVKSQPVSAREDFFRQLQNSAPQIGGDPDKFRRELGLSISRPTGVVDDSAENTAKFNELARQNLMASPQAVGLAKQLLDKELTREIRTSYQQWIFSAARVLETTGTLDPWLKEAREKLLESGLPEVEVLRRLQKVDQRQPPEGDLRSRDYSRKILALDPADAGAARNLVSVAAADGDRKLLLICLRAMGAAGFSQLSSGEVLSAFSENDAAELLSFVRGQNLGGQVPSSDAILALHRYFLFAAPTLAADFRDWLSARGTAMSACRYPLAGQLLDAGRKEEAVDVIAKTFVTPPEYPGFPHQFPPKAGTGSMTSYGSIDPSAQEKDLAFLRERSLFAAVMARIDVLGSSDPVLMATFRMAATPDAATFDQHALPLLEKRVDPHRGAMAQQWIELFRKQPGTAPLLLRLLEERSKRVADSEIYQLVGIIETASTLPGGSRLIAGQWARLAKVSAASKDPSAKERADRSIAAILRPMMIAADDATWRDYWSRRGKNDAPLGPLSYLPMVQVPTGFIDPARLREVLWRTVGEIKGELPAHQALGWALAAATTGDNELMGKVKAVLPANSRDALELSDLASGKTMAVSPALRATAEGNGETLISWNLITVPPANPENGLPDIPRFPFSGLDGKFDIQITAGSEPDRQVIVKKLSAAAAGGHVRLKLAPDQRFVAMLGVDPATGAVRWTQPLEVESSGGSIIPVAGALLEKQGFERFEWDGPGGLPAWKIRFSGRDRVDLHEREWNGSEPVSLGAWVCGDGKLELRCLDAGGAELEHLELDAWDSLLPAWQFQRLRVPGKVRIPAATVRLVLSAEVQGFNDGPLDFAVSSGLLEIGTPAALPEKSERITRLPGAPVSVTLSPDDKRLAVSLDSGRLVIVELSSHEWTEVPLRPLPEGQKARAHRVIWTAAGIFALQGDGYLYHVDEANRWMDRVLSMYRGNYASDFSPLQISADGKWVVWSNRARRSMLATTDGTFQREIAPKASSGFQFTDEGVFLDDGSGRRSFLKTGDFRSGEPVEEPAADRKRKDSIPVWLDRLGFKSDPEQRRIEGGRYPIEGESVVLAADGTIYYVDAAGILIRCIP